MANNNDITIDAPIDTTSTPTSTTPTDATSEHLRAFDNNQRGIPTRWGGWWREREEWCTRWRRVWDLKRMGEINDLCNGCFRRG
jgi:hypothetical protein